MIVLGDMAMENMKVVKKNRGENSKTTKHPFKKLTLSHTNWIVKSKQRPHYNINV
jgi:hypothetical protein